MTDQLKRRVCTKCGKKFLTRGNHKICGECKPTTKDPQRKFQEQRDVQRNTVEPAQPEARVPQAPVSPQELGIVPTPANDNDEPNQEDIDSDESQPSEAS